MSREFHRPQSVDARRIEHRIPGTDPAEVLRAAHETAHVIIDRAHEPGGDETLAKLTAYTQANGLDDLAELWSHAAAETLPGALWRLTLLGTLIRHQPDAMATAFERGVQALATADPIVVGAPTPMTPQQVVAVADSILTGAYQGDLADALDRAASCCRLLAAGTLDDADISDLVDEPRAAAFTARAARLSSMAAELQSCARLARNDSLE